MFTGLIEHIGGISSIVINEGGCTLSIGGAAPILDDCHIGDSIAVNGVCLTVTSFNRQKEGGWFQVWLANETLQRTELGTRKAGDDVNLERAVGAHARFGGHFVQGHVDGTAIVESNVPDGDSLRVVFKLQQRDLLPYLIPKGYVAINGASLTLTAVSDADCTFSVMLVQHTQSKIVLASMRPRAQVNVEVDMVGKYVEKSVLATLRNDSPSQLRTLIESVVESVLSSK
ncbi:Riboflavin synthase alpha chain [Leucoagaricus gongylophorus]